MDEANIPIDIHYNKLSDWLVSRRHCKHDWQKQALLIREKINTAIQDMPPVEEITKLLQGTYINYFHCIRIAELLKATDAGKRNIFGQYSSQHMKDWLEIVNLYDQDGVYLAEAAQLLTRNVNYEIPTLKRQITKCQQMQKDCSRKEHEYAVNASELRQKFTQSCHDMGIEGKRIKKELLALASDLPDVYERIGKSATNTKTGIKYYEEFVKFTVKVDEPSLPMLSYLSDHGNVTTYEFKHGKAPSRVEEFKLELHDYDTEAGEGNTDDAAGEIDWGSLDNPAGGDTEAAIDWGAETSDGEGIDWGSDENNVEIQLVADSTNQIQLEDEDVARGMDALSLLDNTETRNQIVNELLELQFFLEQRVTELKDQSTVLASNQFQAAPSALQLDASQVDSMLAEVKAILNQILPKQMQDLILIRSSPRYVENLAASLDGLQESAQKLESRSRLMVKQAKEAAEEEKTVYPKLDLLKQRTVEIQGQIAGEISKKYKNRKVNIMGEINKI